MCKNKKHLMTYLLGRFNSTIEEKSTSAAGREEGGGLTYRPFQRRGCRPLGEASSRQITRRSDGKPIPEKLFRRLLKKGKDIGEGSVAHVERTHPPGGTGKGLLLHLGEGEPSV